MGPFDGLEGSWRKVPQECNSLTEEYESCSCICYDDHHEYYKIRDPGYENDQDGYEEGKDGYSDRGDPPEHPLGVRRERKIPSCAMNATKNGGKNQQEEKIQGLVILMPWM